MKATYSIKHKPLPPGHDDRQDDDEGEKPYILRWRNPEGKRVDLGRFHTVQEAEVVMQRHLAPSGDNPTRLFDENGQEFFE